MEFRTVMVQSCTRMVTSIVENGLTASSRVRVCKFTNSRRCNTKANGRMISHMARVFSPKLTSPIIWDNSKLAKSMAKELITTAQPKNSIQESTI